MEDKINAWLTRDKDGVLFLSNNCPPKSDDIWITSDFSVSVIGKNIFPNVKWEDDKPTKVELTIKICE